MGLSDTVRLLKQSLCGFFGRTKADSVSWQRVRGGNGEAGPCDDERKVAKVVHLSSLICLWHY